MIIRVQSARDNPPRICAFGKGTEGELPGVQKTKYIHTILFTFFGTQTQPIITRSYSSICIRVKRNSTGSLEVPEQSGMRPDPHKWIKSLFSLQHMFYSLLPSLFFWHTLRKVKTSCRKRPQNKFLQI